MHSRERVPAYAIVPIHVGYYNWPKQMYMCCANWRQTTDRGSNWMVRCSILNQCYAWTWAWAWITAHSDVQICKTILCDDHKCVCAAFAANGQTWRALTLRIAHRGYSYAIQFNPNTKQSECLNGVYVKRKIYTVAHGWTIAHRTEMRYVFISWLKRWNRTEIKWNKRE